MILLIKNKADWELIHQQKQINANKYNIYEKIKGVDHNYKVGNKFMINNHTTYKNETLYKGPFVIIYCWTNGMVTLNCDAKK